MDRLWTGPAAWKPTPIVHSVVSQVSERIARCREELWWSESCASPDFHIFNMPHGQLIDVWAAVWELLYLLYYTAIHRSRIVTPPL